MDDEYYMEDQNEWPYLVWEKKDRHKRNGNEKPRPLNLDFKDIPFSEFSAYVNRLILASNHKSNLIGSIVVRPKNCIFSIRQNDNQIRLNLNVKNEYFTSEFKGVYDSDTSDLTFYFPYNDYKSLESMDWFKNEVKRIESKTGLKFDGVGGGYDFEWADERLTINDEFESLAYFSDGDFYSDSHSYKIDFNNRMLEKYHVHDWIEMNEPFL